MKSLHGQRLLVDFYKKEGMHYDTFEHWVPHNEATIMALGYIPAIDYKTGFGDVLSKVYIKFHGFELSPCLREVEQEDGRKKAQVEEYITGENASTLYDYFTSDAQEAFVNSLKSKKISSLDMKKLLIILLAVVGVGMFVYFFMQSGGMK